MLKNNIKDIAYSIYWDAEFFDGGICQVYNIYGFEKDFVFKEFPTYNKAKQAFDKQKILSKFDLAPKIKSDLCQLNFINNNKQPIQSTNIGFISEKAVVFDSPTCFSLQQIQSLVDEIYKNTRLKFWDCHYNNLGIVYRNNKKKLVCIDTGLESFNKNINAWGNSTPGPKCNYCFNYDCKCEDN